MPRPPRTSPVGPKMMYEGRGFPPEMLPEMLNGVTAPMLGRETKYGLGAILRPTRAGPTYGHSGFFPGYMTDMMYFPEHKIAVAVQVNTSVPQNLGKPLGRVLVEMIEAMVGEKAAAQRPRRNNSSLFCISIQNTRTKRTGPRRTTRPWPGILRRSKNCRPKEN